MNPSIGNRLGRALLIILAKAAPAFLILGVLPAVFAVWKVLYA
ncbi:hypothetical protein Sa4125_00310 [Aureimonas sp. SA4125]|nr:hypothetical protein [Aureimonas sp. SA4125]BDA82489.1 hypothetical protein Sa4125_00310 [Aureimonas sp. SA4125]